jgi:16S rRNA (cytosine1402-N4)-methyltransferase
MVAEVVEVLAPVPPGWVVDATVGGAGHAVAVLEAHPHLSVLGLDQDADAIAAAGARLERFGDRARLVRTRFDRLAEAVTATDSTPVAGTLFDLGVSSPQLDRPERGFSYRAEGPLDMRMDRSADEGGEATDAAALVNQLPERELADLLRRYGDERHADRIARAIVRARPVSTTTELADIVRDAVPAPARRHGGHPAKRSFQALRIAVNDELEVLKTALDQALTVLAAGGRCAVLTYHSGEDRIVKHRFAEASAGPEVPAGLPVRDLPTAPYRFVRRRPWRAGDDEQAANPRSSSARLRVLERCREELVS